MEGADPVKHRKRGNVTDMAADTIMPPSEPSSPAWAPCDAGWGSPRRSFEWRRRGDAFLLAVGVIAVVFVLLMGVMTLVRQEVRFSSAFLDAEKAFQLAESGVEQALFHLKSRMRYDSRLVDALTGMEKTVIRFPASLCRETASIVGPGRGEVEIWAEFEPVEEVVPGKGVVGRLVLHSRGTCLSARGVKVSRQVRAVYRITGVNLGIVAPEHGLFVREREHLYYQVPGFTLDARDLAVYGGKVYIKNGMACELTEHIIDEEFRPMGELGFMDLGYDTFNLSTFFSGGVNFCHSEVIEYETRPVTRKYFDFQGFGALFGPGAAWRPVEELYIPGRTRRATGFYSNDEINLLTADEYRKLATVCINPSTTYNPSGSYEDRRLFRDVIFRGPLGLRNTMYRQVLPLYGWGRWQRVPAGIFVNPTKKDDISNPIVFDGITFVRGDVFIEGWYEGIGTLVVQGNVYLGGDLLALPPAVTGYHSLLNIVVLEDPAREPSGVPRHARRTGKLIYKPHHDMDWDKLHLHLLRDLTPVLDAALYAENGMEVDRTSIFSKFFNMEIEFNFATEVFDWRKLPNDLAIYGTDPASLLAEQAPGGRVNFLVPSVSTRLLSWCEEKPSSAP